MDGVDTIGPPFASSPLCKMLPRISEFTSGKSQGFVSIMSYLQESIMLVQLAFISKCAAQLTLRSDCRQGVEAAVVPFHHSRRK